MSKDIPPQAKFWGLGRPELRILELILHWFNGLPLTIDGEERRIATHRELPLEDMFRGTTRGYEEHAHAHLRLLDAGLLQETYICQRKIAWAPTEQGLQAIRDCLAEVAEKRRPDWADDEATGPIYGDPNELMYHRKGVEIAGKILPRMAWAFDIENHGLPYGIEWYPDGDQAATPDLHVVTNEWMTNWGVEVITATGNLDHAAEKWQQFAREDWNTWWIFDGRSTACSFFNHLHDRGLFRLDSRFSEPYGNWAVEAINRKLWRSREAHHGDDASHLVHTVTGLLDGDRDDVQALFEEYHSSN